MKKYILFLLAFCCVLCGCRSAYCGRTAVKQAVSHRSTIPRIGPIDYGNILVECLTAAISTGADDDSIALMKSSASALAALSERIGYSMPSSPEVSYANSCAEMLRVMIDTAENEGDFVARWDRLQAIVAGLNEEVLSGEYSSMMPVLPPSNDPSINLTLAACEMRRRYASDCAEGRFTLTAAGDTTFGQYPEVDPYTCFEVELDSRGRDMSFPLSLCSPFFKTDDISVLNCEGTFTESDDAMIKTFRFKGKPEYAQMFVNGGVEVVNLANNHTLDYKEKGLADTYAALDKCGIDYFNDGIICYRETNVGKVAFIGYEIHASEPDMKAAMERDIGIAKGEGAKLIVVTFHWGYEYHKYACKYQEDTGRLAVDLGADLVLGHHPHVMQGIELYKGKAIVYSLGNFAFGGDEEVPNKETFIYRQTFHKEANEIKAERMEIIPCYISSVEGRNNYTPLPIFGDEADELMAELIKRSSVHQYGIKSVDYLKTTGE